MTKNEEELEKEMHAAIRAYFSCPITTRPTSWDLGEQIMKIAQKDGAPFQPA